MNSLRDMLGVASAVRSVTQLNESIKKENNKKKKPTGMALEVYRLCGEGLVSKPVGIHGPFTDKKKLQTPAGCWVMEAFTNSARTDALRLKHWARKRLNASKTVSSSSASSLPLGGDEGGITTSSHSSSAGEEEENNLLYRSSLQTHHNQSLSSVSDLPIQLATKDYSFSCFNKQAQIIRYDDEVYNRHLADLDSSWSKEETDYFWDLCIQFDLRFPVICDRYNSHYRRTLEQLKHRYYSVARRLVDSHFDERIAIENQRYQNAPPANILAQIKDERSRHPLVKFTYNAEADVERKQMLDRQFRSSESAKQSERELLELLRKQEMRLKREDKEKKKDDVTMKKKKKGGVEGDIETDLIPLGPLMPLRKPGCSLTSSLLEQQKNTLSKHHNESLDQMFKSMNIQNLFVFSQNVVEVYCSLRLDLALLLNLQKKLQKLWKEKHYWEDLVTNARTAAAEANHPPGIQSSPPSPSPAVSSTTYPPQLIPSSSSSYPLSRPPPFPSSASSPTYVISTLGASSTMTGGGGGGRTSGPSSASSSFRYTGGGGGGSIVGASTALPPVAPLSVAAGNAPSTAFHTYASGKAGGESAGGGNLGGLLNSSRLGSVSPFGGGGGGSGAGGSSSSASSLTSKKQRGGEGGSSSSGSKNSRVATPTIGGSSTVLKGSGGVGSGGSNSSSRGSSGRRRGTGGAEGDGGGGGEKPSKKQRKSSSHTGTITTT